jgi:arylsulfatase
MALLLPSWAIQSLTQVGASILIVACQGIQPISEEDNMGLRPFLIQIQLIGRRCLPRMPSPYIQRSLTVVAALLCLLAALHAADMPPPARPNVLLVLADDLGYSDLGCYGGEIRTPNLDALAANGVRFTQCYNSSRCCPSRASLLTGLYPHQAGLGRFVGKGHPLPGYGGRLSDRCVTLAEVLRPAGYGTYACGKWHVNEPGPIERGFDEFFGFVHGYAVNSWEPGMMIRLPPGRPQRPYAAGEYFATRAITDHALDFLDLARRKQHPWLLYVAYQVAHFPIQAPAQLTARYVTTYERGWDVLRAERLHRMKKLNLVPGNLALPPRSPIDNVAVARRLGSLTGDGRNPAWDSLDARRRADLARRMAVYATMVEDMDAHIGRLVASLRQHDELDNTLILFLSDNGACAEWEPFGFDLDPARFRNPQPGRGIDGATPGAPNVLHEGESLAAMGGPDSLFSYGSAWANLCNTPLWLYKHYAHEGGIRTPLIAHWPARVVGQGQLRPHIAHIMDIMATCVDITGAKYPTSLAGRDIVPLSGRSLLPALLNRPDTPRTLIFEHEGNAAIRDGDWKLVGTQVLGREGLRPQARWELYDLASDPSEQHDRAAEQPALVAELSRKFLEEARRTFVLPMP